MDRRTTRPRTKSLQPTQQPVNEVPSNPGSNKSNGNHSTDSIEPDLPSSEGDIPVASLIVEEIKSSDEITYKIGNVNGSENEIENVIATVKGPVPDLIIPSPENGSSKDTDGTNGTGQEEKNAGDENGLEEKTDGDNKLNDDEHGKDDIKPDNEDEPEKIETIAIEDKDSKDKKEIEKEKSVVQEAPKVNGDIVDTKKEELVSPPKKSRRARELNNLVSTLVGADEPIIKEDVGSGDVPSEVPKSRSGRVLKLKTPSKDEEDEETPKRKRQPKTPKAENGDGSVNTTTAEEGTKVSTPKVARPRARPSAAATGPKPSDGTTPGTSINVLKKAPEKRFVVFPFDQKVNCSREDLLRIPVKIEEGEHFVGDLIWSKVTGYPYWPCMVTIDPLKGVYTELDEKSGEYIYHVQYFGESATRSWTRPKGTFAFEGYDHYKSLEDPSYNSTTTHTSMTTTTSPNKGGRGKSSKKLNPKYAVPSGQRKDWKVAVSEAEFASTLTSKKRIETFTFIYEQSEKSDQESRKRKGGDQMVRGSGSGSGTPSNGPKRKRSKKDQNSSPEDVYDFDEDFDDVDGPSNEVSKSPLRLMSLKKKGDFTVFVQRERSNLKKSNPGLKDVDVDKLLEKNWEFLPEDQKLKYVNRTNTDSPSIVFETNFKPDNDSVDDQKKEEQEEKEVPSPAPSKLKQVKQLNTMVKPRTPACLIARKPRKSTPMKALVLTPSEERKQAATSNLDILDQPLVIDDDYVEEKKTTARKTPAKKATPVKKAAVATTPSARTTPRRGSKVAA